MLHVAEVLKEVLKHSLCFVLFQTNVGSESLLMKPVQTTA